MDSMTEGSTIAQACHGGGALGGGGVGGAYRSNSLILRFCYSTPVRWRFRRSEPKSGTRSQRIVSAVLSQCNA